MSADLDYVIQNNYVAGENFVRLCDRVFADGAGVRVKTGHSLEPGVWYCKTDYAPEFFAMAGRQRGDLFILVTHQSDLTIDARLMGQMPGNVVHWFGCNCVVDHTRITAIPLGIADQWCKHGDWAAIAKRVTPRCPLPEASLRPVNLLARFALGTRPDVRIHADRAIRELAATRDDIAIETYDTVQDRPDFEAYLDRLLESRCVACPAGNGPDTHRVWEALYMGCMPVIGPAAWPALSRLPLHKHVVLTRDWTAAALARHFHPPDEVAYVSKIDLLSMTYWNCRIQERASFYGL